MSVPGDSTLRTAGSLDVACNGTPLNTLPRYRAAVARLRKLIEDAGRDPASIALAYRVHRHGALVSAKADNGEPLAIE